MAVRKYASMLSQLKPVCNLRKVQFLCNIDVVKSYSVWERDRYGDYVKEESESVTQAAKDGVKVFGKELRKFAKERRKVGLPLHNFQHGVEHNDYQVVYKFDNEEVINEWKVVADKAFSQGKSEAEFVLGPQKHGIFRGVVNTDVVKDGVLKYAGYAGIRSPLYMKSFFRHEPQDWSEYTHLLVRCRGDGRPYQLSIGMHRTFDITWHDQFNFPLYTRGGPYWQIAKIPFRKFYLSNKGRVQDKQELMFLDKVLYLTITQCDGYSGPFQLEIDFIGIQFDATHIRVHEYELFELESKDTLH